MKSEEKYCPNCKKQTIQEYQKVEGEEREIKICCNCGYEVI